MNDINRNLHRDEVAGRAEPLDIALVEHYLGASRKGVQVTIDSTHLAQLCNEVWRRRREEREARAAGVSAEARRYHEQLHMGEVMRHLDRARGMDYDTVLTIRAGDLAAMANEIRRRRPTGEQIVEGIARAASQEEHANRLAETATKAIANVGHSHPFEGHQYEATAIVLVANMLAELMQWRSGERVPRNLAQLHMGPDLVVGGTAAAISHLEKLLAELTEWQAGTRRQVNHAVLQLDNGVGGHVVYGDTQSINVLKEKLSQLSNIKSKLGQAAAWGEVLETMLRHNHELFSGGRSGVDCAKAELERLYKAARELAGMAEGLRDALIGQGWTPPDVKLDSPSNP